MDSNSQHDSSWIETLEIFDEFVFYPHEIRAKISRYRRLFSNAPDSEYFYLTCERIARRKS